MDQKDPAYPKTIGKALRNITSEAQEKRQENMNLKMSQCKLLLYKKIDQNELIKTAKKGQTEWNTNIVLNFSDECIKNSVAEFSRENDLNVNVLLLDRGRTILSVTWNY